MRGRTTSLPTTLPGVSSVEGGLPCVRAIRLGNEVVCCIEIRLRLEPNVGFGDDPRDFLELNRVGQRGTTKRPQSLVRRTKP